GPPGSLLARTGASSGCINMNDLYGMLVRSMLFPAWETGLKGRSTLSHLNALHETQWKSRDELIAMQLAALKPWLRHALQNVPHYREGWSRIGITDSDIRTLDDLAYAPILPHDVARSAGRALESTVEPAPLLRKQTSGTTGEPLLFGYEPESENWRK